MDGRTAAAVSGSGGEVLDILQDLEVQQEVLHDVWEADAIDGTHGKYAGAACAFSTCE